MYIFFYKANADSSLESNMITKAFLSTNTSRYTYVKAMNIFMVKLDVSIQQTLTEKWVFLKAKIYKFVFASKVIVIVPVRWNYSSKVPWEVDFDYIIILFLLVTFGSHFWYCWSLQVMRILFDNAHF